MITMLLAMLLAAGPEAGEVREFGDWIVACDNGLSCEAQSLEPGAALGEQTVSLFVQRQAGAHGAFAIGLRSYEQVASERLGLIVDGVHLGWAEGEAGEEFHFPAERSATLAAAVANGRTAAIENTEGTRLGAISLAGSSAAMRYIDDRQGRAGTVTAIAATGDAPASAVPESPRLPRIAAPVLPAGSEETPFDSAQVAAVRQANECFLGEDAPSSATSSPLGEGVSLVLIACDGGAYNFGSLVYLARGDTLTPARFDAPVGWGETSASGAQTVVNGWWDAESGMLGEYAKGRGIGDCGTSQSFAWDGERFRLVEKHEMPVCRGSPYWPTVFRALVVRP